MYGPRKINPRLSDGACLSVHRAGGGSFREKGKMTRNNNYRLIDNADRQRRPGHTRSYPPVLRQRVVTDRTTGRIMRMSGALRQHEGGARQDAPMQEAHMKNFREYVGHRKL